MATAARKIQPQGFDHYWDKITELEPVIRSNIDESERIGDLLPEVTDRLIDEGFYRLTMPAALGGSDLRPSEAYRIFEEFSRIHSAVGWNLTQSNNFLPFGSAFSQDVQERIYGDPSTVWAGSFNPPHKRVKDGDGWRVSGHTPFNSNLGAANWIGNLGLLHDDNDEPVVVDGEPAIHLVIFRKNQVKIQKNWNVMGMKATGSNDIIVEDLHIPYDQAVPMGRPEKAIGHYDGAYYFAGAWPTAPNNAVNAFGIARAAIDDLIAMASMKTPAYTENPLSLSKVVQMRIAEASAKLESARHYFFHTCDQVWDAALSGRVPTMQEKAQCQMAGSYGAMAAADAVRIVHSCVGASGFREEQAFNRYFRDVHTITQHAYHAEARLESVGQIMLGKEPDWGFFHA